MGFSKGKARKSERDRGNRSKGTKDKRYKPKKGQTKPKKGTRGRKGQGDKNEQRNPKDKAVARGSTGVPLQGFGGRLLPPSQPLIFNFIKSFLKLA